MFNHIVIIGKLKLQTVIINKYPVKTVSKTILTFTRENPKTSSESTGSAYTPYVSFLPPFGYQHQKLSKL